jgi:hypothetical protein
MWAYALFAWIFVSSFAIHSEAQSCPECVKPAPLNCQATSIENYTMIVHGCEASVIAQWKGWNADSKEATCLANPPLGTILVDYIPSEISSNNGSFSIDKLQKGIDFTYKQTIIEAYESAIDVAVKAGDKQAEVKPGLFGSAEGRRVTATFQAKGSSAGVRG